MTGGGLGGTTGAGSTGGSSLGGSGLGGSTAGAANTPSFGLGGSGTATESNRLGGSGSLSDTLEELTGRADQMLDEAAETLENAAGQIDQLAGRIPQKGIGRQAGNMASGAADALESVAQFLRDNDVKTLQREVGRIVSEQPLGAVLLAVGAGWVVGKVLR
jgi:hypothetical protein